MRNMSEDHHRYVTSTNLIFGLNLTFETLRGPY